MWICPNCKEALPKTAGTEIKCRACGETVSLGYFEWTCPFCNTGNLNSYIENSIGVPCRNCGNRTAFADMEQAERLCKEGDVLVKELAF